MKQLALYCVISSNELISHLKECNNNPQKLRGNGDMYYYIKNDEWRIFNEYNFKDYDKIINMILPFDEYMKYNKNNDYEIY